MSATWILVLLLFGAVLARAMPVSYTHLDVHKRQVILSVNSEWQRITSKRFRQSLCPLLYITN